MLKKNVVSELKKCRLWITKNVNKRYARLSRDNQWHSTDFEKHLPRPTVRSVSQSLERVQKTAVTEHNNATKNNCCLFGMTVTIEAFHPKIDLIVQFSWIAFPAVTVVDKGIQVGSCHSCQVFYPKRGRCWVKYVFWGMAVVFVSNTIIKWLPSPSKQISTYKQAADRSDLLLPNF